jgi:hypothetical protein
VLRKIKQSLPKDCSIIIPSRLPVWEWRQTFYNIETNITYFCSCFKKAIDKFGHDKKAREHPHVTYAIQNNSFKDNICHLCTGTPSDLRYCHEMYGSPIRVKYGVYIHKIALEENIDERKAEDIVRTILSVPKIGEGWISEAELYRQIKHTFPNAEVIHHGRPPFLGRLEYDIWIPEYKIAIEFQGEQHKGPVDYFGGEAAFPAQQERDERKRLLSIENGVTLFPVEEGYNYSALVEKIKAVMGKS